MVRAMNKTTLHGIKVTVLLTALGVSMSMQNVARAQIGYSDVVDKSFEVTHHVEKYRTIPEVISITGSELASSQYFQIAIQAILNIAGIDTGRPPLGTWKMPGAIYPDVKPKAELYGRIVERAEYLDFYQSIASTFPDGAKLPDSFTLRDEAIRFIDALYMAADILRFYAAFNYLPTIIDLKIASPKGLFPWDVPEEKEEFVGAIRNNEACCEINEHYQGSAMDFEMFELANEIIDTESDVFKAGELIYDWTSDHKFKIPWGIFFGVSLFGHPVNSFEMIRNMEGTSGIPNVPKRGLYPAAGIPYGRGALFVEGRGWFNAEFHRAYGSDLRDNPFYYDDPVNPQPGSTFRKGLFSDDPLLESIRNTIFGGSGSTLALRAFWVNGADVQNVGADEIVQNVLAGEFNAIVLTVKSFQGHLYFDIGENTPLFQYDALQGLLEAARSTNLKVYAALPTLSDYFAIQENSRDWAQRFFEPLSGIENTLFNVSPCISEHRDYLKQLITSMYDNYDVDGLILANNRVIMNAWANPECGMTPATSDQVKQNFLADYVNDLASHAKSVNATVDVFFLTAPLIDMEGRPPSIEVHDANPSQLNPSYVEGIILTMNGLSWLTNASAMTAMDRHVMNYNLAADISIYSIAYVSKEWQYPPEFYRGLARQFKAKNIEGIFLVSNNSAEGELGSAFVKQHYGKLGTIHFLSPPPQTEVPTGVAVERLADELPKDFGLYQNHPNPFNPSTIISYSIFKPGFVTLTIYNILGRETKTLVSEFQIANTYSVNFDASKLSSGIYFYRLQVGREFVGTKKMLLMR